MTALATEGTVARTVARTLIARTVALDEVPDLLAVTGERGVLWRDEQRGLAGRGVALRIDLPAGLAGTAAAGQGEVAGGAGLVHELLGAIAVDDQVGLPGCGPVAVGALPFDPAAAATLVVPRYLVGHLGGRAWVTTIGPAGEAGADPDRSGGAGVAGEAGVPPDEFRLTTALPHAEWRALVACAVEHLRAGGLDKVVLARRVDVTANRPFVLSDVLARLVGLYPSCTVFSVEGFLGASPELLLDRHGDQISSHPLAGTVARSGDEACDEALVAGLLASAKDRWEHQLVVDALTDALGPACTELSVPDRPSVLRLRNVSHLATQITGTLRPGAALSALELVSRVHPTPAVGGAPTKEAISYLQQVEGFDRGRYAGPVGWVDARGDGAWAVGIRCAEVEGSRARMYAGAGVVAGSDPAAELAETQLKLQALLAALVRP